MPSLLYLLFYDAFSDHAFLFLCVSMDLEVDLSTQEERRAHKSEVYYRGGPVPLSKSFLSLHKPNNRNKQQNKPNKTQPKPFPFLPQAQTNTILILNPSFKTSLFPFPRSLRVWSLRPKLKKKKYTVRARLAVGGLGTSTQSNSSSGIFFYWIFCFLGDWSLRTGPPPSSRVQFHSASSYCRVNYT